MAWTPRQPTSSEEYLFDETGDIMMFEDGEGFLLQPLQDDSNWTLVDRI